jgi:hypothetical protein
MNKFTVLFFCFISCFILIQTTQSAPTPEDDKGRCEFVIVILVVYAVIRVVIVVVVGVVVRQADPLYST